jgi:cytochrome c-type biogenesis protein CcmH/NrfG
MTADRLDDFRQMIEKRPNDPMPRYALGMELKNRQQLEESIKTFRELLAVIPDFPAAY